MIERIKRLSLGSLMIWGVVLVLTLAVLGLGAWSSVRKRKAIGRAAAEAAPEERIVEVRTEVVATRSLADIIELPGVLKPWSDILAAAEAGGRIVEMPVARGDRVAGGDLLWRADDRVWAAASRRAAIEAAEAEKEWKRFESLAKSGAVSDSDLDAVRKARDLTAAALDEAQALLAKCEVRSPIAGTVEARLMEIGEYPAEGQVVLRVVDTSRLKLVLDVPEQNVLSLKVGGTVSFTVATARGRTFDGTVRFVSDVGQPESNSFSAEIEVNNAAGDLKAGMIAAARLQGESRDGVIAVPLAAVVPEKGEHVVFVVEDERAVRRTVKLHAIQDQLAILESGLRAGETLVVEGQRHLADGRKVQKEAEAR